MLDIIYFFAYAEMMNEDYFREQGLDFVAKAPVTLSAWKLEFNKIPEDDNGPEGLGLSNIEPTPNNAGMMFGVLYEMKDSFLPRLDEIHGSPNQYVRKVMRFNRHDFTLVNGYVYVARPENTKKGLKPNKAMMKTIKEAKKQMPMLYFSRLMGTRTVD